MQNFFNIDDEASGIQRQLAEGIAAQIFPGEHAMASLVRIAPNSAGKLHSHPQEQWGVLLRGSLTRVQDGEEVEATVGDFWRTPGGVPHTVRAGPEGALVLDFFAPPRPEYAVAGRGFGD